MAADHSSDVLPILSDAVPSFDQAMRGYDRAQVEGYIAQLDIDLRQAIAERDSIAGRSADIAAQLGSAHSQIESLRRQLRNATDTITTDNVEEHVAHIVKNAQADAATLRQNARDEAELIRSGAADAAARLRAAAQQDAERLIADASARRAEADELFRARMAEVDAHRTDVERHLAETTARIVAEQEQLTHEAERERRRLDDEARAERERLDAASLTARARAEDDFEITLRNRRSTEYRKIDEDRAAAREQAAQLVAAAKAEAQRLVDEAMAEVRRLRAIREESHQHLRTLHGRLGDSLGDAERAGAQLDARLEGGSAQP